MYTAGSIKSKVLNISNYKENIVVYLPPETIMCMEIKYRFKENYALRLFKITQFAMSMSSFNRRRFFGFVVS